MQIFRSKRNTYLLPAVMLSSACASMLVQDDVKRTAGLDGHCSGSQWSDDSSIAVLPVPVVAFVTPHADLRNVSSQPYLNRCGAVINREVSVNRLVCIPARLLQTHKFARCHRYGEQPNGVQGYQILAGYHPVPLSGSAEASAAPIQLSPRASSCGLRATTLTCRGRCKRSLEATS